MKTLACLLYAFLVLCVLLIFSGCGATQLPKVLQLQGFDEAQTAVVHDVRDSWCEATGWCPTFIGWGNDVIAERGFDWFECLTCDETTMGHNDGAHVHIDVAHRGMQDLSDLWYVAAHEFGHWGTDGGLLGQGHTHRGLMSESYSGDAPLCIDVEAIDAFCDESGQCTRREPTCPKN